MNVSRRHLLKQGALLVTGGLIANGRSGYSQTTHTTVDTTKVLGALPSELGALSNTKSDSLSAIGDLSIDCQPAKYVPRAWNIRMVGLVVKVSLTTS